MATAIAGGMVKNSFSAADIVAYDCSVEAGKAFAEVTGAKISADPQAMAAGCGAVLLAVKPQYLAEALKPLSGMLTDKLIISIVAGVTLEKLGSLTGSSRIVRVMPNTPMLIGLGVSVVCRADDVSPEDFDFVCKAFEASGSVTVIDEADMNRIISVTSSSPAYVFAFIDAIRAGAEAQGLDGDGLLSSICDVVIGAATLLRSGDLTPAEQIARVTSKGGTTEQAMRVLGERDLTATVVEAMKACTARADEMSRTM